MKIIDLEAKTKIKSLSKNEEKELKILKIKESELNEKIENI